MRQCVCLLADEIVRILPSSSRSIMEISILAVGVLTVLLLSLAWKRNHRGLPSPAWELPIVGHIHLLGKLPHQSLHKLAQKHGGLMLLKLGVIRTLVVSSAEFAKEILRTNDHVFASRPTGLAQKHFGYEGAGLVWATYGDHWRTMRKICTVQLLTSKQVELSQPVRRSELLLLLKELVQEAQKGSVVSLNTKLSDLTFNVMLRMIMSRSYSRAVDDEDKDEALRFKDVIIEVFALSGTNVAEFLPWLKLIDNLEVKIRVLKQFIDAYLDKEILRHRKQLGKTPQDFMDVLLSLEEQLSDNSIKSLSLEMIGAGTETSAVTTEWALAELVKCPECLSRAQEELNEVVGKDRLVEEKDLCRLSYLSAIVKETLRLHPPGPLLAPHESIEACKVGGYVVPTGTRVLVNVYAIARDPAVWDEPLKFNPDRFLNSSIDVKGQSFEYLPFGSGRRSCPGILLGMTTLQLVLASVLHTFDWSLPDGELACDLDMSEKFGLSVPKASPLKLVPTMRLSPEVYANMFI